MWDCISRIRKLIFSSGSTNVVAVDQQAQEMVILPEIAARKSMSKTYSTKPIQIRIIQNSTLIWLDSNINESNLDFKNSLTQLRRIINSINTLTNPDQCVEFLNRIKEGKVFMIVSGALSESIIPLVHDISQLDSIYIFCEDISKYVQPEILWTKVRGIFTQIEMICIVLKQNIQQCNHDSISISVTSKDLNSLEPSFMYSQLLKEILLNMKYDNNAKTELVKFCREQYHDDIHELEIINDFDRNYHAHTPIWWYTLECFTYQMLNRALCSQDIEIIIKMGFFLRDVHRQLEKLHSKIKHHKLITVYRGETMSNAHFEEIKNNQDGLLDFNTFLSTSMKEKVSLEFARKSLEQPDSVAVLFQITVDPSIVSTPFARIRKVSAIPREDEVLFSMHTVFRISQIIQIEDRLWRVKLTSTKDDDQELKRLTDYMRQEKSGSTKWEQLGYLLFKMGNFDKAEEIFKILLKETFQQDEKMHASLYSNLGDIKFSKGDYQQALELYEKSLEIRQKYFHSNHSDLMSNYNSIGLALDQMGEYVKARESYEKSLDIGQTTSISNRTVLAETYNNIATVYTHMSEYQKALESYQKSLEISLESFPSNHPDLATVYGNIAQCYHHMQEYSKAIEFYQESLDIRQKCLPSNHPDLAVIYNNIGLLYCNMGDFPKALEFYHKDLEIKQKVLSENHPNLAITYNNFGLVYNKMKQYAKALEFYEKSLEINLKFLPPNHPELATNYNNIGLLYWQTGENSKALSLYEHAVEIGRHALPENHPHLQFYEQVLAQLRLMCTSI